MKSIKYLKKMDKSIVSVTDLNSNDMEETEFWLNKPPEERFMALEILRQRFYNYEKAPKRLQRFFEVVEQTQS